jgi:ABC-type multidrug transport system ATPase subunit
MERKILSKTIIQLNRICKKIVDRYVLENINLDIHDKDITVITGHNGAGKSTLLKILAGLSEATSGTMTYPDKEIIKKSSFIFQKPIFLNRSVKDNLLHALSCIGEKYISSENIIKKYLADYNLTHITELSAMKLSSGEQQLISFIRSILLNPKILFLDEPTSNLDDNYTKIINHEILKLSKNIKVIIVSQSSVQIKKFTDTPIIMEGGKII